MEQWHSINNKEDIDYLMHEFGGFHDGSVSASGTFVMYDEFTCGSVEEIKTFFGEFDVKVAEVHMSK